MSSITVRSLSTPHEYEIYIQMADEAFSRPPSEESARFWQNVITRSPDFRPEQLRGVFRDEELLGGCIVHERVLRMGAARISTGCIGAVVTSPQARKQGIATALMHDTIAFSQRNHHPLMMLDGIAKFYYRYGYVDMFDVEYVDVDRASLLAQPTPDNYRVRPANVEDAQVLLALYNRHYSCYTGSFERSLEMMVHKLSHERNPLVVVLSPQGEVVGYLLHRSDQDVYKGRELIAENWEALLALLHYHAHLLDEQPEISALQYMLPPDSRLKQWLIDRLEMSTTPSGESPANEWSVRDTTYHHRFAGWMARLVDSPALCAAILPELHARWQRSLGHWSGNFTLIVAGERATFSIDGSTVQSGAASQAPAYRIELTPQAFIQVVFGYRPLSYFDAISHLPKDACSALNILFPGGHTWVPASDWF